MIFWVAVSPCFTLRRTTSSIPCPRPIEQLWCSMVGSWQSTTGTAASLAEMSFFLQTATAPERRVVEVWSKFALFFYLALFASAASSIMQNSDPLPHFKGLYGQGSPKCMSNPLISSAEAMHQHSHGPSLGTVRGKSGSQACRRICVPIRSYAKSVFRSGTNTTN